FKEPHDQICDRRHQRFPEHLDDVVTHHHLKYERVVPHANECDGIENHRIHSLTHNGGTNGPGPEMTAAGLHFHFCEYVGIREFTDKERSQGCEHDSRRLAEYSLVSTLVVPTFRGRQGYDHPTHE